jgi:transposase
MDLTQVQWEIVQPHLPPDDLIGEKGGRPQRPNRDVLNGILWVLRTGAPWNDMPGRYPPSSTCHRRFQEWNRSGVLENVLQALARDLQERGGIDLSEGFIDGTFIPAKKGAPALVILNGAKVQRSWVSVTKMVFLSPYAQKVLRRMKQR